MAVAYECMHVFCICNVLFHLLKDVNAFWVAWNKKNQINLYSSFAFLIRKIERKKNISQFDIIITFYCIMCYHSKKSFSSQNENDFANKKTKTKKNQKDSNNKLNRQK
jgi:hypothetical protein